MRMRIEVTTRVPFTDLKAAEAEFVKGEARLCFEAHPNRSRVLKRAADIAEKFDIDIYIDGELTDPYEIRDRLEREES